MPLNTRRTDRTVGCAFICIGGDERGHQWQHAPESRRIEPMRLSSSLFAFALAFLLITYSPCARADQQSLSATDAWVTAPSANETATTAFVVINNPTMYDVYLVTATTDAAAKVQIRDAAASGSAKVMEAVTVPAFDKLAMTPGGVHLHLVDLTRPLKQGETISLYLTTDGGIELEAKAIVK
jgi:copper(I)-binding protein